MCIYKCIFFNNSLWYTSLGLLRKRKKRKKIKSGYGVRVPSSWLHSHVSMTPSNFNWFIINPTTIDLAPFHWWNPHDTNPYSTQGAGFVGFIWTLRNIIMFFSITGPFTKSSTWSLLLHPFPHVLRHAHTKETDSTIPIPYSWRGPKERGRTWWGRHKKETMQL